MTTTTTNNNSNNNTTASPLYEVLDTTGYTSTLYILPGKPPRACKSFYAKYTKTHFPIEKKAYERFTAKNPPRSLLRYFGVHDTIPAGLVLELAENKNLMKYRWDMLHCQHPQSPSSELLLRWARQAAEALAFAHRLGIMNSDIHPVNMFLTSNLDLKVGDWAGASIDGGISHSSYRLRYRLFEKDDKGEIVDVARKRGIGVETEIFALGSCIWYFVVGEEVWWPEVDDGERGEIRRRCAEGDFPDTRGLDVLGRVVERCWRVEFGSMGEVLEAVVGEEEEGKVLGEKA